MNENLTPREFLMMEQLIKAAERNEPCPNNRALARKIGLGSDSNASQMLGSLTRKGFISILSAGRSRVVTICASGQRTAGQIDRPVQKRVPKVAPEPIAPREPCFACGVTMDRHDQSGCRRWRAAR